MVDLCFVLPCYNGAPFIEAALGRLEAYLKAHPELGSYEILVVDDGSSDGTASIVAERFPGVQLLRLPRNQGKGAAVRHGMLAARSRYKFFIDADVPFDLEALATMHRYLDFKEFDLAIGSRSAANVDERVRRSPLRKISSWLFTAIISRLVVTGVRDTQCGLKGFRAEVADYLFREGVFDGFAFDVETLYLAYKNDFEIRRVPVTLVSEDHSSVSVAREALPMLLSVLRLPLRWYTGRYALFVR